MRRRLKPRDKSATQRWKKPATQKGAKPKTMKQDTKQISIDYPPFDSKEVG